MNDSLATKLKPVEVKPGVSLATMTGELNVSNNKYHLDNFDDGNESKQGGGPAKRQRKEVSPSMIKSGIYAHLFLTTSCILQFTLLIFSFKKQLNMN